MKKYYYAEGSMSVGPFTIEELKGRHITRETLVWYQGLNNWKPAGTFPELAELFAAAPPPLSRPVAATLPPSQANYSSAPPMPKTWFVESILVTLFCCLPLGIAGIVFASKVESLYYGGDYVGAKRASDNAKTFTAISFFLGLAVVGFYGFLFFFGLLGSGGWY